MLSAQRRRRRVINATASALQSVSPVAQLDAFVPSAVVAVDLIGVSHDTEDDVLHDMGSGDHYQLDGWHMGDQVNDDGDADDDDGNADGELLPAESAHIDPSAPDMDDEVLGREGSDDDEAFAHVRTEVVRRRRTASQDVVLIAQVVGDHNGDIAEDENIVLAAVPLVIVRGADDDDDEDVDVIHPALGAAVLAPTPSSVPIYAAVGVANIFSQFTTTMRSLAHSVQGHLLTDIINPLLMCVGGDDLVGFFCFIYNFRIIMTFALLSWYGTSSLTQAVLERAIRLINFAIQLFFPNRSILTLPTTTQALIKSNAHLAAYCAIHPMIFCPSCYNVYSLDECSIMKDGQELSVLCAHIEFPRHSQAKYNTMRCNIPLLGARHTSLSAGGLRIKLMPFPENQYIYLGAIHDAIPLSQSLNL